MSVMCNTTDGLNSPVLFKPLLVNSQDSLTKAEENRTSLSSPASSVTRGRGVVREIKAEGESEDERRWGEEMLD